MVSPRNPLSKPICEMIACPSCRCEMRVCVERGIELDVCDSCNGVWLDAGELTKLSELSKDEESRRSSWTIPTDQECPLTTLHCSRCSDTLLVKVIIGQHAFQGCRICNGLFIDSGTLDCITSTDNDEDQSTTMTSIAAGRIIEALSALLIWKLFSRTRASLGSPIRSRKTPPVASVGFHVIVLSYFTRAKVRIAVFSSSIFSGVCFDNGSIAVTENVPVLSMPIR